MADKAGAGRVVDFFAIDAGGTMTDAVLIDAEGDFQVGKALSTPGNEAQAVMASFEDALGYWGVGKGDGAKGLSAVIYSGTQMINKVLTRQGEQPLGLIVTAGFEDMMRMERAVQVWLGLSYADRLHSVSHHHHEPLIPKRYIRGVRGRINVFFAEMIPLYEDEVYKAVEELLDEGIKGLCVCLLFSFKNPSHEQRVREIAREVMKKRGIEIPIYLSCECCPVRGEFPRAQTTVLEAYAAAPSRPQFENMKRKLQEAGSKAPLRLMTCYGGSISPEHRMLVSTMSGGPVGGVIGSKYLGELLNLDNIVCSDVGGTSFDTGLISEGRFALEVEPSIAWMKTAIPAIVTESIGAGTGMYVRLDPVIKKIELGPGSAGYKIGMCVDEKVPTVNDCNVVLGYLNPDYFLGGKVKLSVEKAYNGIKKQLSDVLGIDVYEAAEGIKKLVDMAMRDSLGATVMGRGFSPEAYSLMCYGGGGPMHAASYSEGLNFQNVFIPAWAAAFSAFGCACAEYSDRIDHQIDFPVSPDLSEGELLVMIINQVLGNLKITLEQELQKQGLDVNKVVFKPTVRMQYRGQLDDIEVAMPEFPLTNQGLIKLIDAFNDLYGRIFPASAKSPELGYLFTRCIAQGVYPTKRPILQRHPSSGLTPEAKARKPDRKLYFDGKWHNGKIYEMDELKSGNLIKGPAVIEAPNTTLLVPPGSEVRLNAYRVFELRQS
jgi:N-methylhydantoinase A/acetone carboxylase beta subunit